MHDRSMIGLVLLLVLFVVACGDDDAGSDLVGGAVFTGTFDTGPGFGPGVIEIELNDAGDRLSRLKVDPALNGFVCPGGSTVSGGGWESQGTMALGDDYSFSVTGFSGVFDSSNSARGSYDLNFDYNSAAVLTWTATGP